MVFSWIGRASFPHQMREAAGVSDFGCGLRDNEKRLRGRSACWLGRIHCDSKQSPVIRFCETSLSGKISSLFSGGLSVLQFYGVFNSAIPLASVFFL
jgi:hypothetical protein